MAYQGQIHALRVPIQPGWDGARLAQAFNDAYREKFGNTLADMPVVIVNLRTVVIGVRSDTALPHATASARHAGAGRAPPRALRHALARHADLPRATSSRPA